MPQPQPPAVPDIAAFYEATTADYAAWSRVHNMHFGYCGWGAGAWPWRREAMLERMNVEVLRALRLPAAGTGLVLDLGCGLGTAIRTAARLLPRHTVVGVTVTAAHVIEGNRRLAAAGVNHGSRVCLADFTRLPQASGSAVGAYAIESACYAPGPDKAALLAEAARVLARDGRLVVADAFLLRPLAAVPPNVRRWHDRLCAAWRVPRLGEAAAFATALAAAGFCNVSVRDITWRVAPSVLHVPWVWARYRLGAWLRRRRLAEPQRANLAGSLAALGSSRFVRHVGYYLIAASRA